MDSQEHIDNIQFIGHHFPKLPAGVYDVSLEQTLDITGSSKPLTRVKRIALNGPKYQLPEGAVHSCFPPTNGKGTFGGSLPMIILRQSTLPWERTAGKATQRIPWLALIVLDETDEAQYNIKEIPVAQLNRQDGELPQEGNCQVLEINATLLENIVPKAAELQLLTHVRKVSQSRKEGNSMGQQHFAVITANRIAEENRKTQVCLVSLEGYYDDHQKERYQADEQLNVQLICLHHWTFQTTDPSQTLAARLDQVSQNSAMLRLPPKADEALEQLLAQGYTFLKHHMRQGDKTVSLYRSPFLPFLPTGATNEQLPALMSDQLLRYQASTGLFDTTYAAAWQLGRLLALQDTAFAQKLLRYKKSKHSIAHLAEAQPILKAVLTNDLPDEQQELEELVQWFQDLKHLKGIPNHYLIPDPKMLPQESIRFFYLDQGWMDGLVDGAISLGRNTLKDKEKDKPLFEQLAQKLFHTAGPNTATRSGILLRSEIVAQWPGLEWEAFGQKKQLTLLHTQKYGENILLCLFQGNLDRLQLSQPAESAHTGFTKILQEGQTQFQQTLRDPQSGQLSPTVVDVPMKANNVVDIHGLAKTIQKTANTASDAATFSIQLLAAAKQLQFVITKPQKA